MMTWVRIAWSRISGLLRRPALDRRLEEEIAEHLELLTEKYEASGMNRAEARLAAKREFGGVAVLQESFREQSGLPRLEDVLRDMRMAVRSLFRDRLVAAVCVLSLGLAIGIGTAVFSAYEAAVLRPLPFSDSASLVLVFETSKEAGRQPASLPNIHDLRDRSQVFTGLSAWSAQTMALSGNGAAERVRGGFVSAGFFQLLKPLPAQAGRIDRD